MSTDRPTGPTDAMIASSLWEELTDGLLLIEGDHIVRANPAAAEIFGYRRDQLDRMVLEELLPLDHRSHHRALRREWSSGSGGRPLDPTRLFAGRHANGSTLYVGVGLIPLHETADSRVLAVIRRSKTDSPSMTDEERERLVQTLYAAGLHLRSSTLGGSGSTEEIVKALDAFIADLGTNG